MIIDSERIDFFKKMQDKEREREKKGVNSESKLNSSKKILTSPKVGTKTRTKKVKVTLREIKEIQACLTSIQNQVENLQERLNHISVNNISTSLELVIDYHNQGISKENYLKVIQTLTETSLVLTKSPKKLSILLSENVLKDEEVVAICKCVLDNDGLRKSLVNFDLSHNYFTNTSLHLLREVWLNCPKLETLNLAINFLDPEECEKLFDAAQDEQRAKVKFNPY